MKFFTVAGHRYHEDGDLDSYVHPGTVYGPYPDDAAVSAALQRLWPNDKDTQAIVFDGELVNVPASSKEKPENEKRQSGDMNNYEKRGDAYFCRTCDGKVMVVRVAHPIHFNEFPGAGGGECQYEEVPYCPNCEHRPSESGAPISVPMVA